MIVDGIKEAFEKGLEKDGQVVVRPLSCFLVILRRPSARDGDMTSFLLRKESRGEERAGRRWKRENRRDG